MSIFASSHQEVIRFYITMQHMFLVKDLDPLNHLLSYLQHCLYRKTLAVVVK